MPTFFPFLTFFLALIILYCLFLNFLLLICDQSLIKHVHLSNWSQTRCKLVKPVHGLSNMDVVFGYTWCLPPTHCGLERVQVPTQSSIPLLLQLHPQERMHRLYTEALRFLKYHKIHGIYSFEWYLTTKSISKQRDSCQSLINKPLRGSPFGILLYSIIKENKMCFANFLFCLFLQNFCIVFVLVFCVFFIVLFKYIFVQIFCVFSC